MRSTLVRTPPELVLVHRARALLLEAEQSESAADRFRGAHLAALRATAALFAAAGPGRASTRRPVNAWALLTELAPDLSGWARLFAASAPRRAAVEAGLDSAVTAADAEAQLAAAHGFLDVVEERLCALDVALAG